MKILCIDGNSILNRAFYGIKLLSTKDGVFTNGIYGFLNILLKLCDSTNPEAVAIAFDVRGKNFRHEMFCDYKANRKGMPQELAVQMPILQELLTSLGYNIIKKEGFEADDVLGTLSKLATQNGDNCFIATGDRDSLQLINDNTTVLLITTKQGTEAVDEKAVLEKYGVLPNALIDVKALMGDSSDNVPGVAGVGEKTALDLIQKFKDLDGVYQNIESDEIKKGVKQKLSDNKDMAYLSRELVTINRDVPIENDLSKFIPTEKDEDKVTEILTKLEMFSMLARFSISSDVKKITDEQKSQQNLAVVTVQKATEQDVENFKKPVVFENDGVFYAVEKSGTFSLDDKTIDQVLQKKDLELVVYDAKKIYNKAFEIGTVCDNIVFDIKLAAYLLNPLSNDYSLQKLATEYGADNEFLCEQLEFAGKLCRLYKNLETLVVQQDMKKLLDEIELPLSKVLCDMENEGFLVDTNGIVAFGEQLTELSKTEKNAVFEIAGEQFNLNSPKQLGEILYNKLKINPGKKTKTGFSTNAETLEALRSENPIVEHILKYRSYQKLNSTYVEGLVKAADENGRIHTEFKQTETRTGRISSRDPNLQNIPVRTELGSRMRSFFVAKEGYLLLDADYSQIELRVLSSISDDVKMQSAFKDDRDIHTETASEVFKLPRDMINADLRRKAKAVNFGIVYGMGAFSLSKDINVSVAEASRYIDGYLETYSGVKAYLDGAINFAKKEGYVTTLFGRRRNIPEIQSSNKMIVASGKRLAMNTPIQGTAADIIKIAMIRVANELSAQNLDAKLILQVHDELIVEASASDSEKAAQILKQEMETAANCLSVPVEVEVSSGKTWFEAK